jgi:hypothetical protein
VHALLLRKSRHIWEENSSDATETSDSESSSSDSSNERGKAIKKQQLLNRLMIDKQKGIGGKKIQMHIPKELPAFKIQALRRQKSQVYIYYCRYVGSNSIKFLRK